MPPWAPTLLETILKSCMLGQRDSNLQAGGQAGGQQGAARRGPFSNRTWGFQWLIMPHTASTTFLTPLKRTLAHRCMHALMNPKP